MSRLSLITPVENRSSPAQKGQPIAASRRLATSRATVRLGQGLDIVAPMTQHKAVRA
jgi:hypothetical protein